MLLVRASLEGHTELLLAVVAFEWGLEGLRWISSVSLNAVLERWVDIASSLDNHGYVVVELLLRHSDEGWSGGVVHGHISNQEKDRFP